MTRVFRLDVEYPAEPDLTYWAEDGGALAYGEEPRRFQWPIVRKYLTKGGAETRADLLRQYGATVTVVASEPVAWPDEQCPVLWDPKWPEVARCELMDGHRGWHFADGRAWPS